MKHQCDWCGREKFVSHTKYGTSKYKRLICDKCAEDIITYEQQTFGVDVRNEFNGKQSKEKDS